MKKLFGTDGIRGIAYDFLTPELCRKVGEALGYILSADKKKGNTVLIGKDTRESGDMVIDAIADGLTAFGCEVHLIGVVPTSAISFLTKSCGYNAGIMISASHNPYEYNGIKIFNSEGFKLDDALEESMEELILGSEILSTGATLATVKHIDAAADGYINYITKCAGADLSGMKIVFDCANGSASRTARAIFDPLGAECVFLSCSPDGKNINLDCGSTHMESLRKFVLENKFDVGIAFDGDADRCLAVDERGELIDGDMIMAILGIMLKERGDLSGNTIVATVMSNLGLFKFADDYGLSVSKTAVGDRYVLEELVREGFALGGEQSGHIIMRDILNTGDGQLTALLLLSRMAETKKPLSKLASIMKKYPQTIKNLHATAEQKTAFKADIDLNLYISDYNDRLCGSGRILVRPSGTEPLIRVMVEAESEERTETICNEVANAITEAMKKYN
ncbi:MAG: phosphoglucosamine mutase [Ruminococcaceae bacterium]|nr:phosphoglucosamine mutase [Oscillospiraceae bacterium]